MGTLQGKALAWLLFSVYLTQYAPIDREHEGAGAAIHCIHATNTGEGEV